MNLHPVWLERPGCGSGKIVTIQVENAPVAIAPDLLLVNPVFDQTTQVRTFGRKGFDLSIGCLPNEKSGSPLFDHADGAGGVRGAFTPGKFQLTGRFGFWRDNIL